MKTVFVVVALFLSACAHQRPVRDEAHRLVNAGALLVDVRTPQEFAASHLPGAVNIPVDALQERLGELGSPEQPVVVYCGSGARSSRAERLLKARGFQQVVNLGPMSAWE
ncbi:rhodanese-like domain-containing protein [Myxococcus sp. Y35]|uniref:rhodanese-like domain-containing protein n=1 Tax=Pseudomyxococcus flavus TaxID=3115648 RepID=UPI003CF3DAEC